MKGLTSSASVPSLFVVMNRKRSVPGASPAVLVVKEGVAGEAAIRDSLAHVGFSCCSEQPPGPPTPS